MHVDDDRSIKPSLFSHASEAGMSVTRIEHAGLENLKAQQTREGYLGYVFAKCSDIRRAMEGDNRLHCIYDTALDTNTAHADVCQAAFGEPPKGMSRQVALRIRLMNAFTDCIQDANELSSLPNSVSET